MLGSGNEEKGTMDDVGEHSTDGVTRDVELRPASSSLDDVNIHFSKPGNHAQYEIIPYSPCSGGCTICGSLPFLRSTGYVSEVALWEDAAAWDWDGGLYDLVRQMNGHDPNARLTPDMAKSTVEATTKHLTQLKEQLMKAGIQKEYNQKYTGDSTASARVVAPFDFSELVLGKLLGTGGFSSVTEVVSFTLRTKKGRQLHEIEEQSRSHLLGKAQCHAKADHSARRNDQATQYAVKHLRSKLVTRTPEKFKRAAIDLVLEGQLLLVLDHPHIVSMRGWSGDGPTAFSSGDPRDFFLLLDKLPESLEDRMWAWRTKLIKYQRRLKRRTVRQRNTQKVSSWVRRKLGAQTPDEESPESDKFALKIQMLLLERLETAFGIASAIQFMHSKRLIHRDLKTANVGFDVYGVVKLFDLGLSRLLPSKTSPANPSAGDDPQCEDVCDSRKDVGDMTDRYVMSRVGTKFYMAPEIRRKEPYNTSADVYSFGVILWEILSLATPQDSYHDDRSGSKYHTSNSSWLPVCSCWSAGLQSLVTSTLSDTASDRPTMQDVVIVLEQNINTLCSELKVDRKSPTVRRGSMSRMDLSGTNFIDSPDVTIAGGPGE